MKREIPPFRDLHWLWLCEGKMSGVRLGQWFMNEFIPTPDPELYYEPSSKKALEMALDYYVDFQWPME